MTAWLGPRAQDPVLALVGVCRPAATWKAELSVSAGALDPRLEATVAPASDPSRAGRGVPDLTKGPLSGQLAPAQVPVVPTSTASAAGSVAREEVAGGGGGAPAGDVHAYGGGGGSHLWPRVSRRGKGRGWWWI